MKIHKYLFSTVALLGGLFILLGANSQIDKINLKDLPAVKYVSNINLNKIQGTWHEIARIPNKYQKWLVGNKCNFEISGQKNSEIKCVYTGHKKYFNGPIRTHHAKAWPLDKIQNGRWDMQFLWPFKFSFWIIAYDFKKYEWIIVGHPERKYLWIYARKNSIGEKLYENLLNIARKNGYKSELIAKTPQPINKINASKIVSVERSK